ncbi:hypothetical protein SAMN05216361_3086 [Marisediminitalea aggregata]|uniref:ATP-binding protein n=1 Tax=Marisediminitalea aggregata TaxID=634436 RepID=A0A1M5N5T4_9ALTE|nr:DUF6079 family protein [Marisediminitalea aggregata]SHG84871.1 hypothetical protein SAMN05216361_3086 [Marisediminitalea aggregata]
MKKYGELIQFEPVNTIVKLQEAAEETRAQQLVASYVISDKMSVKIADVIIPQLQFTESLDNKSLWIVGNYGSGKSHLMSVLSAVAEFPGLAQYISNEAVRTAADKIAGKFKVIRFEIGASKKAFADIITDNLTKGLADFGIDFHFPEMTQISSNHKPYFEQMMGAFHEKYPDQGLLLICDEMLDYLRSRNTQELPLDIAMMRVLGEVIDGTRFRFICGVQEAIFDSAQLSFASQEVKRIRDRAEQVLITRDDIKYVVAERLLKKNAQQMAWIREYLQKFTHCFDRMSERLDEFVRMFPVHPDYITMFERVRGAGIEQRQVLRSLSRQMQALMELEVPETIPGVFSYDTYWEELRNDPSAKTNPEIGQVIEVGETLFTRIDQAYPAPHEVDFAKRLVAALAIHRMSVGDIFNEMGATAAELRDSLCLYLPLIEQLPGEKSKNLENQIVAVLTKIRQTVNGQFFSKNKANDQFYLDLKKTEDFDAYIENKVPLLADDQLNNAYRTAMLEILQETDVARPNIEMWEHELKWLKRNVNRPGWLFLGSPNQRETAKPPLDYYMYFVQPINPPKMKKEYIRSDEVLFVLDKPSAEFDRNLKFYAAAIELQAMATGNAKNIYQLKARAFLQEMQSWLKAHYKEAYLAQYNGQSKPMMEWLKGTNVRGVTNLPDNQAGSLRDIFETVASVILGDHFESLAPEYPTFSQAITYSNIQSAATDALGFIAGGAATKRANAVLDALELLDGEQLKPAKSRYAQAVLDVLSTKEQGQVVNKTELLEQIHSRLYFKPTSYRLEPEWLLVILASLVHSGELELSVVGHHINASDVMKFRSVSFDVLKDFKHIQAPKDFNVAAIKALLNLLEMNEGLATSIQQGDESVVRDMMSRCEKLVQELVLGQQSIKGRLPLWGNYVVEESEASTLTQQVSALKEFLEVTNRFNTPGKLKNFKSTTADIGEQANNLSAWKNYVALRNLVDEFKDYADYLSQAENILTADDTWQTELVAVRKALRDGLTEASVRHTTTFKTQQLQALQKLKVAYQQRFIALYNKARLSQSEEKQKQALLKDARLQQLEMLSGIHLLPAVQLQDWRNQIAKLKEAEAIDSSVFELNPQPVDYSPRLETVLVASQLLKQLDDKLDSLLTDWASNLKSLLDDPFIKLDLLKDEDASEIQAFISSGTLPEPLSASFIAAVNQVLDGLEEVRINQEQLLTQLGQGLPQTVEEVTERFKKLLAEKCQGKELSKVRIIID